MPNAADGACHVADRSRTRTPWMQVRRERHADQLHGRAGRGRTRKGDTACFRSLPASKLRVSRLRNGNPWTRFPVFLQHHCFSRFAAQRELAPSRLREPKVRRGDRESSTRVRPYCSLRAQSSVVLFASGVSCTRPNRWLHRRNRDGLGGFPSAEPRWR